tara:strand:- start:5600 stop:5791 length:192 start_codon:yes stop_codon:yes gene_type:complete
MVKAIIITLLAVLATSFDKKDEPDNTLFYEVPDSTGNIHLYRNLNEGSVYCYKHLKMEQLAKK